MQHTVDKQLKNLISILIVLLVLQVAIETLEEFDYFDKLYLNLFHVSSLICLFLTVLVFCLRWITNKWVRCLILFSSLLLTIDPIIHVIEEFSGVTDINLAGIDFEYFDAKPVPMFIISCFLISFYLLSKQLEHQNQTIQQETKKREQEFKEKMQLRTLKEAAEDANKAKSQFLANMSHEIRTPLNGVLGVLHLIKESRLDIDQKELVLLAESSGNTLLSIVNDVLDYSKIEAGKLELNHDKFDIYDLINKTLDPFSVQIKNKGIVFNRNIPKGLPAFLVGDSHRVCQIITNVIGNALKFTEEGSIDFNVYKVEFDEHSIVLRFEISDTGIGISPELQERIFDVFYQADGKISKLYQGSGLGLAICSQLVKLMKGAIGVESNTSHGSTFWFTIPFQIAEMQYLNPFSEVEMSQLENIEFNARILIVEDNPVNQTVVSTMLHSVGIKVNSAMNGLEGVKAFQSNTYDLILMDCQMPEMDGYEAVKQIRKMEQDHNVSSTNRHKRMPVIAMTAYALEGEKEKCLHAGMDDYISKPFVKNDLTQILMKWLPDSYAPVLKDEGENVSAGSLDGNADSNQHTPNGFQAIQVEYLRSIQSIDIENAPHILRTSIETYLDHAKILLVKMNTLMQNEELTELSHSAHNMNSSSLNMGALSLSEYCSQMEMKATQLDTEELNSLIGCIEKEFQVVEDELRHVLHMIAEGEF